MSIEELLKSVVAAIESNTFAVQQLESTLVGRAARAPKEETEAPKKSGVTRSSTTSATSAKTTADAPAEDVKEPGQDVESKSEVQEGPASEAVPYETVRTLVLKLAPTQREAIKALNAKHGINNLKALLAKEDDFSTVNDQPKLEAVYADLLALEA